MKGRWVVGLPIWVWIILFVVVYIVIKSPSAGLFIISLPARLISGIGNFFIGLIHSYGG